MKPATLYHDRILGLERFKGSKLQSHPKTSISPFRSQASALRNILGDFGAIQHQSVNGHE